MSDEVKQEQGDESRFDLDAVVSSLKGIYRVMAEVVLKTLADEELQARRIQNDRD